MSAMQKTCKALPWIKFSLHLREFAGHSLVDSLAVGQFRSPSVLSLILSKIRRFFTLFLIGFTIPFFLQAVPAEASELRDIRIGCHKRFTRIVFEFNGSAVYTNPEITGRKKLSVVFVDSTTTLPGQVLRETTKGVDGIDFVQLGPDLVADITLSFPYRKFNPFTLSDPQRIVLDVYPLSAPPEDVVLEASAAGRSNRVIPEEPQGVSGRPFQDIVKKSSDPLEEPPTIPVAEKAERDSVHASRVESSSSAFNDIQLQTYFLIGLFMLLGMLFIFSVLIAGLVILVIFQVRRGSGERFLGPALEAVFGDDESIAVIDRKIKDQLKNVDQSLSLRTPCLTKPQ